MPRPGWFQEWVEVQRKEDERVLAELRDKIGPDGDLKAAYRAWYENQMREHTEALIQMLRRLHEAQRQSSHDEAKEI